MIFMAMILIPQCPGRVPGMATLLYRTIVSNSLQVLNLINRWVVISQREATCLIEEGIERNQVVQFVSKSEKGLHI